MGLKIFTFVSHRPELITIQMQSFRKYLKEDFEFIVFDNTKFGCPGSESYGTIHEHGKQLDIPVIDVLKDQDLIDRCQAIELSCPLFNSQGQYSNANVSHAYALRWAWENVISKERGPIAIFDSDIFLIQPVKLTDSLNPYVICNTLDGRTRPDGTVFHYMWPTFFLADMARLPDPETLNWWCGRIDSVPVDVGGQTYHYYQAHPNLDIYSARRLHSDSMEEPKSFGFPHANYDEFYLKDGTIVLHYRSGSNWDHKSAEYHAKKTEWLKRRIEEGK